MKELRPERVDESLESEITIWRDGRIHAFGITPELVELLAQLPLAEGAGRRLLERLSGREPFPKPEPTQTQTRISAGTEEVE